VNHVIKRGIITDINIGMATNAFRGASAVTSDTIEIIDKNIGSDVYVLIFARKIFPDSII
jgi:hypothetical protein